MTQTHILLLTLLSVCLVTITHWLRDDVRPLKFKIPPWAQSVLVIVLGSVFGPAIDALVSSGTPFATSVLTGLITSVPALIPLVLDAGLRVSPKELVISKSIHPPPSA